MKTVLSSLVLCLMTSSAFANINYKCVSEKMQAANSDIFYDLSKAQIDAILKDEAAIGHDFAVATVARCESENAGNVNEAGQITAKGYACIASQKSELNHMSPSEIDSLLVYEEQGLHWVVKAAAKACGVL